MGGQAGASRPRAPTRARRSVFVWVGVGAASQVGWRLSVCVCTSPRGVRSPSVGRSREAYCEHGNMPRAVGRRRTPRARRRTVSDRVLCEAHDATTVLGMRDEGPWVPRRDSKKKHFPAITPENAPRVGGGQCSLISLDSFFLKKNKKGFRARACVRARKCAARRRKSVHFDLTR